jgi:hypothetical protein
MLRGREATSVRIDAVLPEHNCERPPELIDTRENIIDSLGIIGVAFDFPTARTVESGYRAGVMVAARLDSRDASSMTLEQGDLIHAVNGAPVGSPAESQAKLAVIERGRARCGT